ncbi:MAG: glycosyltransferase [Firmicutes bacterium]|nr:glycosyltransferase [Bacillota bacterium]
MTLSRADKSYITGHDGFGADPLIDKRLTDADIIHMHWVDKGFVGRNTLKAWNKTGKPFVFTMHDMRFFTGACHYDNGCGGYVDGCKNCPIFKSGIMKKTAAGIVMKNTELYHKANAAAVGCSTWITDCARQSSAMRDMYDIAIPNPIDINVFHPKDKSEVKKKLGIDPQKKVIVFGAMNSTSDKRKGYTHLVNALKYIPKDRVICVVFGGNAEREIEGFPVVNIGLLKSDEALVEAYSCGDVFIAPSIQENLANTVMESCACGTPVVAFDIGGMKDMIISGHNGFLAEPFDDKMLAEGIVKCMHSGEMGLNARAVAEKKFNNKVVAQQYINVYNMLLNKRTAKKKTGD